MKLWKQAHSRYYASVLYVFAHIKSYYMWWWEFAIYFSLFIDMKWRPIICVTILLSIYVRNFVIYVHCQQHRLKTAQNQQNTGTHTQCTLHSAPHLWRIPCMEFYLIDFKIIIFVRFHYHSKWTFFPSLHLSIYLGYQAILCILLNDLNSW